jgi:hypothetical protein
MTIQVGMLAGDGIVIATDTRWTHTPDLSKLQEKQVGEAVRYGTHGIKINCTEKIAVSYAADKESSIYVAGEIVKHLELGQTDPETAVQSVFANIPKRRRFNVQGLIAMLEPSARLFKFQIGKAKGTWSCSCEQSLGFDYAGDFINPAIFWIENYYDQSLSAEKLVRLAAHFIYTAHELANAGIDGLQIAECTDKVRPLSHQEIIELWRKAQEWDRRIGHIILDDNSPSASIVG